MTTPVNLLPPRAPDSAQRAQDIIDDFFDLGLIAFAVTWEVVGINFDQGLLTKIAMAGGAFRAISRRIFRVLVGPRINRWVKRQQEDETSHSEPPNAP